MATVVWWKTALLLTLSLVVYSDFKRRELTLWLLLALATVAAGYGLSQYSRRILLEHLAINVFFLLLQLALVWCWFVFKHRRWSGDLNQYIGLGDGLFLLAVAPSLAPAAFVWFYTSGMVISLIFVLISRIIRTEAFSTIPLAGCLAGWLICWLTFPFHPTLTQ